MSIGYNSLDMEWYANCPICKSREIVRARSYTGPRRDCGSRDGYADKFVKLCCSIGEICGDVDAGDCDFPRGTRHIWFSL